MGTNPQEQTVRSSDGTQIGVVTLGSTSHRTARRDGRDMGDSLMRHDGRRFD